MPCASTCPDEQHQQDAASPGPIEDHEILCRGAFGKKAHYNSQGVKASFIKDKDLLEGTLSIWRLTDAPSNSEEIRSILSANAPPKNTLWDMFTASAATLRGIRAPSRPDVQALHAYDDCVVDGEGNKHPSHAVLSICGLLGPESMEKDAPLYAEVRDLLVLALRQSTAWSLPTAERV